MSKQRAVKNDPDARTMSINERVLKDIRGAYLAPEGDDGKDLKHLVPMAKHLHDALKKELDSGVITKTQKPAIEEEIAKLKKVLPPPERVTVMMIGNHSAGKSSFINWYVDEHVQRTSEAVETTGITIIRRGKQRVSWKGDMTFAEYPHLSELESIKGLRENIRTEISCSNAQQFPLIDFVDTPGLTDGTLAYPFNVDEVIMRLADYAHMILVFLDPHGQALVNRTMCVVRALSEKHLEKMHFYLARADMISDESERNAVSTQCVQELTKNLHVTHGFKLLPVYLPSKKTPASGPNKIQELCVDIQREIENRIQDSLRNLKLDTELVNAIVDSKLHRDQQRKSQSRVATAWKFLLGNMLLLLIAGVVLWATGHIMDVVPMCKSMTHPAAEYLCPLVGLLKTAEPKIVGSVFLGYFIIVAVGLMTKTRKPPTMDKRDHAKCKEIHAESDRLVKLHNDCCNKFRAQST